MWDFEKDSDKTCFDHLGDYIPESIANEAKRELRRRGYVKHCKESVEEAVVYIEVMCRKYNANQVIICTNGFGIAIYDYLISRKLDWLDIVPFKCVSERFG